MEDNDDDVHRISGWSPWLERCLLAFGHEQELAAKSVTHKTAVEQKYKHCLIKTITKNTSSAEPLPIDDEIHAGVENPHCMWNMAQANDLDKTHFIRTIPNNPDLLRVSPEVATHPKWRNKVEGGEDLLYVLEIISYIFCQIQYFKEIARLFSIHKLWQKRIESDGDHVRTTWIQWEV